MMNFNSTLNEIEAWERLNRTRMVLYVSVLTNHNRVELTENQTASERSD